MRLAATGDRAAFGELVTRHGSAVRTHLRRMGAQASDADDMAQEALITAYEHLADYRSEGSFSAWLKRIAARRYLRRIQKEARYLLTDDVAPYAAPVEPAEDFRVHNLDAALNRLKAVERLCLTLNFSGELSHQAIADELKLPLGTVKSHIRRALDQLKLLLAPAGSGVRTPDMETGT